MPQLRAAFTLIAFLAFTLPLMPVQLALLALNTAWARRFPHWYHGHVCRILGVRIHCHGALAADRAVLLIANHVSWLDIPVMSAVVPVSFVAKREIAKWPFIGWLAKLQRSVFIDREKRKSAAASAREIMERLRAGDHVVLFAEGTSSDGNRVLAFRTALFGAALPSGPEAEGLRKGIYVQTLAIAYTHRHGLPLGRRGRPLVAWYGDMDMASHAWPLLKGGPLDVHVRFGAPVELATFRDRKALARFGEAELRKAVAELLTPRRDAGEAPSQAWSGPGAERG